MDAAVLNAYDKVFRDDDPTSWCVCQARPAPRSHTPHARLLVSADKKGKLLLSASGLGGLSEATSFFKDDSVSYAWVRLNRMDGGGDSKRVKFVLLTWIGEARGGAGSWEARLTRARTNLDRLQAR